MKILLVITEIINLLTLAAFICGFSYMVREGDNPKTKADLGVFMGVSMCFYLLLLIVTMVLGLFAGKLCYLLFLIYPISVFGIGKLVKFATLKPYSVLQMIILAVCAVHLGIMFFI